MQSEEEFSEWYGSAIERAGLSDKRYPIKGMNVWTPYGWAVQKLIDAAIRAEFDATGHGEVNFPLLVPETEFQREADHIKGFEQDVYWVTHAGLNPLDIRLVLRPTSETAMYPMFALWVRSHADLPLKVYQIVNVFRYETKVTRTFMRVREIHFFESHTVHATREEAEQQVQEDLQINERLMRTFCLPYVATKRPDWDKFAGAAYSVGVDALMPSGRTLQLAGIHQYFQNFAKAYDLKFEDAGGEHVYAHQTTDGMSERILGAIVAVHGDGKGVVLPPEVAPVQAVVVPIPEKGKQEAVGDAARQVYEDLRGSVRAKIDGRDIRPGAKFYEWEAKGVPLRIEVGPREIESGNVTVVRRDTGEKKKLPRDGLPGRLRSILELIQVAMFERAEATLRENTHDVTDLTDVEPGISRVGWCGEESCGHTIEDRTGMGVLGTPFYPEERPGTCVACGEPSKERLYLARAY